MADFGMESGPEDVLDGDEQLVLLLARGVSVRKAVEQTELSERTIRRRLADPDFRSRVSDLRGTLVSQALGHLARNSAAAAKTLRDLLKAESESIRLSAARAILEIGTKLQESQELADRVAKLEQRNLEGE